MALAKPQTEPVRFHVEDDIRLPRRLSTFLRDQIESLSVTVLQGQLTYDDYKDLTGQIRGMGLALEECERIEKEIQS